MQGVARRVDPAERCGVRVCLDVGIGEPLLGWRWRFGLAAIPGVLCVLVVRCVPESPRRVADHGRHEEALATMASIEAKVEKITGEPLPQPAPTAPVAHESQARSGPRELLTGRYRRRTLVVRDLWFCGCFVNYGISSWLPTVYGSRFHGPIVVGAVCAGGALGAVFVTLAAVALVGSLTAGVATEETSGGQLEEVAP